MSLTLHENETLTGQTLELTGHSFVRCQIVDCTLILRDGPCEITDCQLVRCNWRIDQVIRWDDAASQKRVADVLDQIRVSVGKPSLASEILMWADLQINPYATHLPVLMACVNATGGPVLEMGCGNYSTPVLSQMCKGRKMLSVESDAVWMAKFTDLAGPDHQFIGVKDWSEFVLPDLPWDVVFIDHAPAERRIVDIGLLMDKARMLVVHDTESADYYGYESILPKFRYRFDYKRWTPWTTVVSQAMPLDFLGAR